MSTSGALLVIGVCLYLSAGLWAERQWTELSRPRWITRVALVAMWGPLLAGLAVMVALTARTMQECDDDYEA